jgi:hypothetical protein
MSWVRKATRNLSQMQNGSRFNDLMISEAMATITLTRPNTVPGLGFAPHYSLRSSSLCGDLNFRDYSTKTTLKQTQKCSALDNPNQDGELTGAWTSAGDEARCKGGCLDHRAKPW